VGDVLLAGGHAVERAVRLDVVEGHALGIEEALERAYLVDEAVRHLLPADLHLAPAEALAVGERRVGAHLDPVLLREAHGRRHVVEVRGVEAAGDVGDVDVRHQPGIVADPVEAKPSPMSQFTTVMTFSPCLL
jgi:hypothetical protein